MTSNEQINALIARDEEEYNLFQKIDEEREKEEEKLWRALGNTGPRPPRLMIDDEVPDWMKTDFSEIEDNGRYGRGMRERPEVIYDDHLTDIQFEKVDIFLISFF